MMSFCGVTVTANKLANLPSRSSAENPERNWTRSQRSGTSVRGMFGGGKKKKAKALKAQKAEMEAKMREAGLTLAQDDDEESAPAKRGFDEAEAAGRVAEEAVEAEAAAAATKAAEEEAARVAEEEQAAAKAAADEAAEAQAAAEEQAAARVAADDGAAEAAAAEAAAAEAARAAEQEAVSAAKAAGEEAEEEAARIAAEEAAATVAAEVPEPEVAQPEAKLKLAPAPIEPEPEKEPAQPARPEMDIGRWLMEIGAPDDVEDVFLEQEIDTLGDLADVTTEKSSLRVYFGEEQEDCVARTWAEIRRINPDLVDEMTLAPTVIEPEGDSDKPASTDGDEDLEAAASEEEGGDLDKSPPSEEPAVVAPPKPARPGKRAAPDDDAAADGVTAPSRPGRPKTPDEDPRVFEIGCGAAVIHDGKLGVVAYGPDSKGQAKLRCKHRSNLIAT